MLTPDGKVLAAQGTRPKDKTWTADLLDKIDAGLQAFGPVESRPSAAHDSLPDRGVGVRADGGVHLAAYVRLMLFGTKRDGLGIIAIDSVPLSATEWAKLAPDEVRQGATWEVPAAVVRKFNCLLSPGPDQTVLPSADEVTEARLTGTVERVAGGVAYLRFEGRMAGEHSYQFKPHVGSKSRGAVRVHGVGTADAKDGKLRSLTLLAEGEFRDERVGNQVRKYGGVVEWDRAR